MGKKGHKGMIFLMVLMISGMAALYIHIMWINRPVKADAGRVLAPSSSATAETAEGEGS